MSQPVRVCLTKVEKCFAIRNTRGVLSLKICLRKVPKNKLFLQYLGRWKVNFVLCLLG